MLCVGFSRAGSNNKSTASFALIYEATQQKSLKRMKVALACCIHVIHEREVQKKFQSEKIRTTANNTQLQTCFRPTVKYQQKHPPMRIFNKENIESFICISLDIHRMKTEKNQLLTQFFDFQNKFF